jgi:hypothetical protein
MNIYEKGLDIMNELRLLPLNISILNKYYYDNSVVLKKFKLTDSSVKFINKIKDIKIINMDDKFNNKIIFPKGVKDIMFGRDFNQEIKLPKGLKKLTTGRKFNQMIKLRSSLEFLNLGKNFRQPVDLPQNLKYLSIFSYHKQLFYISPRLKEIYIYMKKQIILPLSDKILTKHSIQLLETNLNDTRIFRVD